jgi:hypothetical protein
MIRRPDGFLDRIGKLVRCFLCNLNHFAIDCPLKEQLEPVDETQVQPAVKKLAALGEVSRTQPEPSKAMVEGLEALMVQLDEFKARNQGWGSQDREARLCFVDMTVTGVKVATSVDTDATHNFVSEWTARSPHCKPESNMASFKVVNSTVKPVARVVCSAPLRVGSWFGSWDLTVAPLDDHAMILGQDFLKYAKAVPVPHESFLVFLDEAKTPSVPMTTKRKLGQKPRSVAIKLIEGVCESADKPCDVV